MTTVSFVWLTSVVLSFIGLSYLLANLLCALVSLAARYFIRAALQMTGTKTDDR